MNDFSILNELGLIVGAAALLLLATRRLRIPTILAYIVAGLLLGPALGLIEVTHEVELIAEVGIALLLFLVGLELNFARIREAGATALMVGGLQMAVTFGGAYGLAWLLGFSVIESVVLGIAMMFSSTVVVVKLLAEQGDTQTLYGRIAVGVLLVQDLVVVIVLTVVAGLAGGAEGLDVGTVALSLGGAFLGMGALLVGALVASRYLLERPLGWIARMPGGLFIWALLWCFVFVVLAEELSLSIEIGAFLAGISIAQLPFSADLERRVHPLVNFFLAVFFVVLGVQLDPGAALGSLGAVVALSLLALVGKPVLIAWLVSRRGTDRYTAFTAGVTLAQISEFSLIFAAAAFGTGLIGGEVLSLLGLVAIVTIGLSAFLVLGSDRMYAWLNTRGALDWLGPEPEAHNEASAIHEHVIVVGMNPMGRRLVERLAAQGETVLAIDTDPIKLEGLSARTMIGDASYASVLEEARLHDARMLVSALQIEAANNLMAFRARQAGVPTAIHAFDNSVVRDLETLGVDYLIRSKNEGTKQIVRDLRAEGVLT